MPNSLAGGQCQVEKSPLAPECAQRGVVTGHRAFMCPVLSPGLCFLPISAPMVLSPAWAQLDSAPLKLTEAILCGAPQGHPSSLGEGLCVTAFIPPFHPSHTKANQLSHSAFVPPTGPESSFVS